MHRLHNFTHTPSVEVPERFTYPYCYLPHPLVAQAADELCSYLQTQTQWQEELDKGKMLGVLVVTDQGGALGFLAAYSGLLAGSNDLPYFVPAVYDFLKPDSYFVRHEALLVQMNQEIATLELSEQLNQARLTYQVLGQSAQQDLEQMRLAHQQAKEQRHALRRTPLSPEQEARLIKESQFQKAEMKRLKLQWQTKLNEAKQCLMHEERRIQDLKSKRRQLSDHLQHWIFSRFELLNGLGETQDLNQIFRSTPAGTPPAGAGECALPKLLQYAFKHQLTPRCFGEFWWGASPKNEVRQHLKFYPSCTGKCKPILGHMLKGLEVDEAPSDFSRTQNHADLSILYEDAEIVVIHKPAGMLSVPGLVDAVSAFELLQPTYPDLQVVHRLDMATSGVMIFAKNHAAHFELQRQFIKHEAKKTYVALVEGVPAQESGLIRLPLSPDLNDRPRQVVDEEHGKAAVTFFRKLNTTEVNGRIVTRMELSPQTGRTHQLRVHCAHHSGLGCPIVGDELYGTANNRLYLHAETLTVKHPQSGKTMRFKAEVGF